MKYISPLEQFYKWEKEQADKSFFRQAYNGEWLHINYANAGQEIRKIANYLISLNLPKQSKIAIISKNCAHWVMSDLAIMMAGHVSVPLYPTITAETIQYCLEHSEAKVCFVGKLDEWHKQHSGVPSSVQVITFPYWEEKGDGYINWNTILDQTEALKERPILQPEDLLTIIYTSGTTGMPKGVMHNVHAFAFAIDNALKTIGDLGQNDRFFSYLPLSHIAERMLVEMGAISTGSSISFAESLDTFANNLQETQPTIFFAVPRIWTKFQMGILAKMPQNRLNILLKIPILNNIIKNKIKAGLGLDKAKYIFSGAAPLPKATSDWFEALDIVINEAYAMTENCAYSHINLPNKRKVGSVGTSLPFNEVKLTEEEEILVKSDAVMIGYYKDEEKTKETITADGFLCTGDQGKIDAAGFLTITGRVKDIFKTDKGKYVAPAPIENELSKNTLIEQVCVVGANLPQTIALIVLAEDALHLDKNDIANQLQSTIKEVNTQLDKHEKMKKAVIMREAWTVENNLLTPTLKVKRNILEKAKEQHYQTWYEHTDVVVWEV
ncbi:MAG: AMP-binding protein [Chitinophagales bacterium]|nr:AMP-binding protein [Chitinophagales bacterium]